MSFLSGTTTITHATPIPAPVRKGAAVARLQDHEFFLHCDPHYTSHRTLPQESPQQDGDKDKDKDKTDPVAAARETYQLPADLTPTGGVTVYEVVDHVPNPVWSSTVVSREEFVDFADGLWVRLRSPMGVVMETVWTVRERGGDDGLELVEDVKISCSRLLLGIVKGQVEGNWTSIHKKIVDRMVEDAGKEGAGGE
ncbi:hypothetical protein F5X99DRAFT_294120 [Biscogniauxia marginata]|nr:hypothetical protein F5X99DRAFT_294120 [Biscogniauxia marginata]